MNKKLFGTGVALVTPFTAAGEIDWKALEKIIDFDIANSVNYFVILGTTGETATLTHEEKIAVWKFAKEKVAGRVPLVAGIGGNNTAELVHLFSTLDLSGYDAILSVSPYYNKPTQEGIFQHYMKLAEASPLPIIIYNVPSRTSSNISAETILRLANASEKFIAVKEASGNFAQVMQIIKSAPENFSVISGDDNITVPLMSIGAIGVISVAANSFPKVFCEMVSNFLSGDIVGAATNHYKLFSATELLFAESSPAGVKAALNIKGLCEPDVRLPLVKATENLFEKMKKEIADNNI